MSVCQVTIAVTSAGSASTLVIVGAWDWTVAFAVADVHPDPGSEVVMLTSKGVWAWRPTAGEKERAIKLIDCTLLWQLPFHAQTLATAEPSPSHCSCPGS